MSAQLAGIDVDSICIVPQVFTEAQGLMLSKSGGSETQHTAHGYLQCCMTMIAHKLSKLYKLHLSSTQTSPHRAHAARLQG